MAIHASLAALLRLGAGHDIAIGVPVAGRADDILNDSVGFFVNTLVLRALVTENITFAELIAQVRKSDLEAYAHQDVPFDRIVDMLKPTRTAWRNPLFQVMLNADIEARRWAPAPGPSD